MEKSKITMKMIQRIIYQII